jgi:hypothetical protein
VPFLFLLKREMRKMAVTVFQSVLIALIFLGFMGVVGEKENERLRTALMWITICAMVIVFLIQVLL